ncbi:MAG TPA: response regulator transcription factor [Sphingomonadaceae bacterium]|nr:response regulator transcription factor [Sphingomonadaceae bacterium]
MAAKLLIVEDDQAVLAVLEAAVRYGGFASLSVGTGREALAEVSDGGFAAVLLDLGLPDTTGDLLLQELRQKTTIPILVVSGRGTESSKINALDLGADDFIEKPFLPGELLARIRAAIRRSPRHSDPLTAERLPLRVGSLVLDPLDRTVRVREATVQLNEAEHRILFLLATEAGDLVSRAALLRDFYGDDASLQTKILDVYISRLRAKLRQLIPDRELIVSQRGAGWSLVRDI